MERLNNLYGMTLKRILEGNRRRWIAMILALALCLGSARDAERARWGQYRAVWRYVEGGGCRRTALLAHFGDRVAAVPTVACCDICAPEAQLAAEPTPAARPARRTAAGGTLRGGSDGRTDGGRPPSAGDLDAAILGVVGAAAPPVGRTRAVEILRGGRSKVVAQYAYDRLAGYGAFGHLRSAEVLARVDQLLEAGILRSTGGRFPKLQPV